MKAGNGMGNPRNNFKTWWLPCILLAIAVVAVYWHAPHLGYVSGDDFDYVTGNTHVLQGLSPDTLVWSLTGLGAGNWHPLTWISLMTDVTMADGPDPRTSHIVNVLFHLANTLLLFVLLRRMTGRVWPSAIVAALFGVHPLHVESVAWISERKDVLSTFFWLLTTLAYVSYTRSPKTLSYVCVAALFALGLAAKPMLVSLPLTLLLLDYWPLGRLKLGDGGNVRRLLREKAPLFVLSLLSCCVTFYAQKAAMAPLRYFVLGIRVANAIVASVSYLGRMIWPFRLAGYYPHPGYTLPVLAVIACGLLLVGVTYFALRTAKRRPYILFGWLWYLVTLVPVIGLVQVGGQGAADRYTYIPLIGIFVAIVWGVSDLVSSADGGSRSRWATPAAAASVVALVAFGVVAHHQVYYWQDDVSVWTRAAEISPNEPRIRYNLGCGYSMRGQMDLAISEFRLTLKLDPVRIDALINLGYDLLHTDRLKEAEKPFLRVVQLDPHNAVPHHDLGAIYEKWGQLDRAISEYTKAVRLDPDNPSYRESLEEAYGKSSK